MAALLCGPSGDVWRLAVPRGRAGLHACDVMGLQFSGRCFDSQFGRYLPLHTPASEQSTCSVTQHCSVCVLSVVEHFCRSSGY